MPAKYLVVQPPGAPVPGVGFIRPGFSFTAPSEDYVPSRTFRPLNEEAQEAIEAVYATELKRLEAAKKKARKDEHKDQLDQQLDELKAQAEKILPIVNPPAAVPAPKFEMSLKDLGELTKPPEANEAKPAAEAPKPTGGRAADR